MSERVTLETQGHVAVITLDRPEMRNAIDLATAQALADALDHLDADAELRVGVLRSTGEVFSAGMDLKAFAATGERPIVPGRGAFGIAARPPAKPMVAAVQGSALGGGFELALCCDLVVADERARFGLPEVKRGLVAAAGGVLRLPRRIPRGLAMEIALTGEPIDAVRAAELGLVNRLAPEGTSTEVALELAEVIAQNAPLALRATKDVIERSATWDVEEWFDLQEETVSAVRTSRDAAEGAKAFADKRPPVWSGS